MSQSFSSQFSTGDPRDYQQAGCPFRPESVNPSGVWMIERLQEQLLAKTNLLEVAEKRLSELEADIHVVNDFVREFGYWQGEIDSDLSGCLRRCVGRLERDAVEARAAGNGLYRAIVDKIVKYFPPGSRDLEWDVLPGVIGKRFDEHSESNPRVPRLGEGVVAEIVNPAKVVDYCEDCDGVELKPGDNVIDAETGSVIGEIDRIVADRFFLHSCSIPYRGSSVRRSQRSPLRCVPWSFATRPKEPMWVWKKGHISDRLITAWKDNCVEIGHYETVTYEGLYVDWQRRDGLPCGELII